MDKLKTVIDGIKRIERKIDSLTRDKRLKVTPEVREEVLRLATAGMMPAEIGRQLLLRSQVKLSDPTIRKIIKGVHRRAEA